ncbi:MULTISPECIES: GtrA family protein [unclassified Blastococcus]|uniref:GtrA family protein n=1 Tax=unclassified Blastococcus TaxID=2619396 RepID=UPI001EF066EC|nr:MULTISPECIES: GtrA family protein [unclassified Blastococcus]
MTCVSPLRRGQAADPVGDLPDATAPGGHAAAGRVATYLRGDAIPAQFLRFVLVGGASTVVYALLFVAGHGWGYLTSHLVATAASTVLANELHRRLTFHADERVHWFTAQWEAGGVTVLGLLATSTALGLLDALTGDDQPVLQIATVVGVTAFIGLLRFIALRWIFRPVPARA